jgi:MSHA biogenesis protein MshQ
MIGAIAALLLSHAAGAVTVSASPSTCASVAGVGTVNWTNPARAISSNNSYATASVDGTVSRYLVCTGYNFAIPAGATINGITVSVERRSNRTTDGGSRDAAMRLVKAGVIGTTDRSTATTYTTADVTEAHGGATDLWGTAWTPADINAANFGAAFAATKPNAAGPAHAVSVDYVRITIDYTYAPGTYSLAASPTTCASVTGIGTVNWGNPTRAISSNNSYATASVDGTTSRYLRCTGYNFAIPADATISGITVNVERRSSSTANGGSRDAAMRLVKAGVIGTTDRSTATIYTTADVIEAHGGAADLWGTIWTPADINAANFGAAFAATKPNAAGPAHTVSVDHVPITVTFTITALDHIRLEHTGSGVTCAPSSVTVKACMNAACTALSTTPVTVTLSPGAGWSANPVTFTGSTTLTLAVTAPATVTLGTSTTTPAPSGASPQCYVGATANCNHAFADTGFILSAIPTQTAGANSGAITLQAVRKADNSTACVGVFTGNVAIDMASQCINPSTCAGRQVRINATAIANNPAAGIAAYTPVTLNFGANSTATFTLNYPDVGAMSLSARYALGGGNFMRGTSNTFVVKPFGFSVSNIQTTAGAVPNPGAANASGPAFIAAGDAFSVTVTALAQGGAATPNFGREAVPEGVLLASNLVAPAGGANPALTNANLGGGSFAAGVATSTNLAWGEVGIITLTPQIADGDYLGAGNVSGTTTGNIGRFHPHHFVASGSVGNRANLACAPASSFTYMGEPMSVSLSLTAQNASNAPTANYTSASGFAKLDPATAAWLALGSNGSMGLGAVDGTNSLTARLALSGTPSGSWLAGVGSLNANVVLTRGATVDGPYDNLRLGIAPRDTDGVTVLPGALDLNADAVAGNERVLIGTTQARYGRLRLTNAFGSERLALNLPLRAEYFNGALFVAHGADSCTPFTLATDLSLGNWQRNLNPGETTPGPATLALASGAAAITLSAPGIGNNGSVDLTLAVPAWLQFNWTGAVANPKARASFGIYSTANELIYRREQY